MEISTVRICGIDYDIIFHQGLGLDEEDTLGGIVDTNVARPKIVIDINQPGAVQRETLLHELLHASDRVSNGNKELPERHIDRLSRVLYGVGRDNFALMMWIFGNED